MEIVEHAGIQRLNMSAITNTKYAIVSAADQTIVYQTEDGHYTISHPEAMLWQHPWDVEIECDKLNNEFFASLYKELDTDQLSLQKAAKIDLKAYWRRYLNSCDGKAYWIEEVTNEQEFRSREDTW